MRIVVTKSKARYVYENVDLMIADAGSITIWQPALANKRGNRRTVLDPSDVIDMNVETQTKGTNDEEDTKQARQVDSKRSKN